MGAATALSAPRPQRQAGRMLEGECPACIDSQAAAATRVASNARAMTQLARISLLLGFVGGVRKQPWAIAIAMTTGLIAWSGRQRFSWQPAIGIALSAWGLWRMSGR
jgi:hypothetical protein